MEKDFLKRKQMNQLNSVDKQIACDFLLQKWIFSVEKGFHRES